MKENEIEGDSGSALCNDDMWRPEEEAGSVMLGLQRSGVGSVSWFSNISSTYICIHIWWGLAALPHFCLLQWSPAAARRAQISRRCWTTGNLPSSPKWKTCWSMTTPPSYLNIAGKCSLLLTVTINKLQKNENKKKQDVKLFCLLVFMRYQDLRNFQRLLLRFARSQLCLVSDLTMPLVPKQYGKCCSW